MIKLAGAAVIILATTFIGFEYARHLRKRTKQLRYFRNALQALEAEIMYGHIPLQEASIKLAGQFPHPVSLFFLHFSEGLQKADTNAKQAWDGSLEAIGPLLAIKQKESDILSQFGATLGKHDRYQQQKHIHLTMSYLEREEEEALQVQSKYEKMAKSLGFLSGVLLTILLL